MRLSKQYAITIASFLLSAIPSTPAEAQLKDLYNQQKTSAQNAQIACRESYRKASYVWVNPNKGYIRNDIGIEIRGDGRLWKHDMNVDSKKYFRCRSEPFSNAWTNSVYLDKEDGYGTYEAVAIKEGDELVLYSGVDAGYGLNTMRQVIGKLGHKMNEDEYMNHIIYNRN